MKIVQGFDEKKLYSIAKNCGSDSVRKTVNYLRVPAHNSNGFICEVLDDVAFFGGVMCKKHFRLYEMAVDKEYQGSGYGTAMIMRMKQLCRKAGAEKITLRTSKEESAIGFYYRIGGRIVGDKGNDYEVEIKV